MATQGGFWGMPAQQSNPFASPDVLQQQARFQQNQALAGALLQQSQQPLQGQMVSGHYVAPNWTQGLAKALQAYAGYRAWQDLPQQQADLQRANQESQAALFGLGPRQASPQQVLASGAAQGSAGPTNQNAQAMGQMLSGQSQNRQPALPLLPGRSAQESFIVAQGVGLPAYLKLVAEQSDNRTDAQKNLAAAGIQEGSPQWRAALQDIVQKQGYIAPVNAAPGSTALDPITLQPRFSAPQNGIQQRFDPQGNAYAAQVPGFAAAQANITGAEAAAKADAEAARDLVTTVDPSTGDTVYRPRSQVVSSGATAQLNPATVDARAELGKVQAQADQMLRTINLALDHPGLKDAVGFASYNPLTMVRGTDRANFDTVRQQLEGQAFLQAFESLKGGGVITNIEGEKATQAIARLGTSQDSQSYRMALNDLKTVIDTGLSRARDKARLPAPERQQVSASAPGSLPRVSSQEELRSLPSGTVFQAPDGSIRRVP